ncbi:hypothetical protein N7532_006907 [Penicillium argentinense]|uniref:Uncharacterized protein n=1 Tax=Penicillium argentinense TaxID=1131581 RepID=A0A9W9FGV1_9EURO|nr:uncharacterized protein N7532_006907 [Penicillium argentinense]KAJ5099906.1 hypothetical protein N7532_006907 [Penicillium argentinense]
MSNATAITSTSTLTSTTTTTNATHSTTTSISHCGGSAQYELPIKDAACGIPNTPRYKPLIETCARPASVQSYNHNCALYTPAINQTVQKLTNCLYDAGVEWEDVWCFGSTDASATATEYPTATSATKTSSTSVPSSVTDAGVSVEVGRGGWKVGVVVVGLAVSGLLFGV